MHEPMVVKLIVYVKSAVGDRDALRNLKEIPAIFFSAKMSAMHKNSITYFVSSDYTAL